MLGDKQQQKLSPPLSLKGHREGVALLEPGKLEKWKRAQALFHSQLSHCQTAVRQEENRGVNTWLAPLLPNMQSCEGAILEPKLMGSTEQGCPGDAV